MNDIPRFPTDPAAPERPPPNGALHVIQPQVDPRVAEARDVLIGASTMGFVAAIVIGMRPRDEGFTVIGMHGIDALRIIGQLEVAKRDVLNAMIVSQPRPVPPTSPPVPPRKEP